MHYLEKDVAIILGNMYTVVKHSPSFNQGYWFLQRLSINNRITCIWRICSNKINCHCVWLEFLNEKKNKNNVNIIMHYVKPMWNLKIMKIYITKSLVKPTNLL